MGGCEQGHAQLPLPAARQSGATLARLRNPRRLACGRLQACPASAAPRERIQFAPIHGRLLCVTLNRNGKQEISGRGWAICRYSP